MRNLGVRRRRDHVDYAQTSRVVELIEPVKRVGPKSLVILGGVNARWLLERFFAVGADLVCLSEAERSIVEMADVLHKGSQDC